MKRNTLTYCGFLATCVLSSLSHAEELWVTAGTTEDLSARRAPYHFVVPDGKSAGDIVDIAIDGKNNTCFVWFRGSPRQVSAGSSDNLGKYRKPYTSSFPENYDSGDVVGIAINEKAGDTGYSRTDETTFVFFRDGRYTAGTTDQPYQPERFYRYVPADGKSYDDIVAIAMDGDFEIKKSSQVSSVHLVAYAWYRDGTVSAGFMPTYIDRSYGAMAKLDSYRKPYNYKLPKNWKPGMEILGIGIDGENNHVYTWYRTKD
ncbi:MAG: hypothetical protein KF722_14305 [Nitrospira sp.]|nr:hypothetical protein [Nitrospira sp.]